MIYKFFSAATARLTVDRLAQVLDQGTLWAANPATFNDPFECKVKVDINATDSEKRERYFADNPNATEDQYASWRDGLVQGLWHTEQQARMALMRHGITCLCRAWENELMWAHYARNHTGFCIGFDEKTLSEWSEVIACSDVSYTDDIPAFRFFHDAPSDFCGASLFSKSDRWAYEREVRLIFDTPGAKALPPHAIRELIIGCRAENVLRRNAIERLSHSALDIYEACEDFGRYRLTRHPLSATTITMTSFF